MDEENTTSAAQKRAMLHSYEQQLLAARRLARFRVRMAVRDGSEIEEPDPAIQRKKFVQSVANELFNSLVFTGVPDDVMEEIRAELKRIFKKDFEFSYPPGSNLCVYVRDDKGLRPLSEEEEEQVRQALIYITNHKVDKSMLKNSPRSGIRIKA